MLFIFGLLLLVSCSSSKPVVRTTKKSTPVTRTTKKPVAKTTTTNKSNQKSSQDSAKPSTEVLEATSNVKVTTEMVLKYIDDFKDIAKDNMRQHGIPASITLAQGILESGVGQGSLSKRANNHFGIKCHKEWTGPSVRHDDDSAQECFRKYDDPADSYRDHSLFLTTRSRYSSLFDLPSDDYKAWAKGLRAAGYATDTKYPDKLISLIERYQLNQYDTEVLGKSPKSSKQVVYSGKQTEREYVVTKGDTLYSLSKKFNISIDEIKRNNNMKSDSLSVGQVIYLK
ncbi:MAG TPA: glucosaminidase domain-containing protein [Flavobacterium sp.]|uniref:glucosaminidase domain-containing protein n=1 Tax=unclassified Flavobacterium TaxID=196869 RepID=UPI0025B816E4|nr:MULTISPECIES: glucosaminidase domain-containing protein [unclassified Flavobacterium]HRE79108.1 glucosaminidase domain-containing protein [Flavobacterium sp.]